MKRHATVSMTNDLEMQMSNEAGKDASEFYDSRQQSEITRLYKQELSTGECIDFILVYVLDKAFCEENLMQQAAQIPTSTDDRQVKNCRKRLMFEERLKAKGMLLEKELGPDGRTVYVKVHAPFDVLLSEAERINLNMPLAEVENAIHSVVVDVTNERSKMWHQLLSKMPHFIQSYFSEDIQVVMKDVFQRHKLNQFLNHDNEELFFTSAQRALLVWNILMRTRYGRAEGRVSISRLLHNESYIAAFPLHDSPCDPDDPELSGRERCQLYQKWGRYQTIFKVQPLEDVRNYFGEKIAIYFSFLGFYTMFLVLPAFIGLLVFFYGLGNLKGRTDSRELCNSDFIMCGLCEKCDNFPLSDSCEEYEWSYVFDNEATIFFAFFMAVWASIFLDFWKRQNAVVSFKWGLLDFQEREPIRGPFRGTTTRKNPITMKDEKHYPSWKRKIKYFGSLSSMALMIALVIIALVAVIVYRLAIRIELLEKTDETTADQVSSGTGALLNLGFILLLNFLYKYVAIWFTDWENHKTESKYEYHVTLKIFLFQFVNSYASLFYIAFFKGRFSGVPGDYNEFFGFRQDVCPPGGCLLELTVQLFVVMVGKQAVNNVVEIVVPKIIACWQSRVARFGRRHSKRTSIFPWEREFQMLSEYPPLGLFEEYLELVIQFGFITLFVSAFPLAPLFALANNILEVRVDSHKLLTAFRRPPALRASDIGIWRQLLDSVGVISVITSGLVIALTSEFVPKFVYRRNNNDSLEGYIDELFPLSPVQSGADNIVNCRYRGFRDEFGDQSRFFWEVAFARLAFFIVFEHMVFFCKFIAASIIPNTPKWVTNAIKRKEYLTRSALERQYEEEDDVDQLMDHPYLLQGVSRIVSEV